MKSCERSYRVKAHWIDVFVGFFGILFSMAVIMASILGVFDLFGRRDLAELFSKTLAFECITIYLPMVFWIVVFPLFFKNGSLGKKMMKIKLIDDQTKEAPTIAKRIIKNCFSWGFSIASYAKYDALDMRSIGDKIINARVVNEDYDN